MVADMETKKNVKCEIYSRCSGYFRPVMHWNPGKKAEFADRKFISQENISECIK